MEGDCPEVPIEMTKLFHRIDRELYSILVFNLQCNPKASMLAIAFWIWLENITFENVVTKILSSSLEMINGLFNEAVVCLGCIANTMCYFSHTSSELSLTQYLLGQHLSLKYLYENRVVASDGIKKVVSRVCLKALKDLMEMAINNNTQQHLVPSEIAHINCFLGQSPLSQSGGVPRRMPTIKAPKGRRTMFATFSKGVPVCEGEIRWFFGKIYGDCIDSISMQVVKPNEQPLFALVVFTTPGIIDFILNGNAKAKFSIDGKQIWMRRFLPKP